jgi:ketosteroid isomerase-like protein
MIHPHKLALSTCFLFLFLPACDGSRETADDTENAIAHDQMRESALQSLRDADEAWDRSTVTADSFASFWADNGMWLWMDGQRVDGIEGIRAEAQRFWSRPGWELEWEPTMIGVNSTYDVGYTAGEWKTLEDAGGGQVREVLGSYMAIWKKDESGVWKVDIEIEFPDQLGIFQRQ